MTADDLAANNARFHKIAREADKRGIQYRSITGALGKQEFVLTPDTMDTLLEAYIEWWRRL